jgi:transcriptional regulator with XRE-family HTH domain
MTPLIYHVRDCARNTNVMQDHGLITDVKTLAERIVWARERKGLTQEALANKAGVSQGTIGNLESGARKAPRSLLAIAAVLGVEPQWLASGKEPSHTPDSMFTGQVIEDFNGKIVTPAGAAVDPNALASVLIKLGDMLGQLDGRSRRMVGVLLNDLALSPGDAHDIAIRAADIAAGHAARLPSGAPAGRHAPFRYSKLNPESGIDLPTDAPKEDKGERGGEE